MIECACGCKKLIAPFDNRNRPRKYIWGHANKEILKRYSKKPGDKPWNKGIKTAVTPWNKGLGDYMRGEKNPFYGKKHTNETRQKMRGPRNGNWKNGASRINDLIRKSKEYLEWKAEVFIRDNRTCIWCGSTQQIEADHIKPFSTHPDLRFDINNGRTLCHECHKKTDTYGNKKKLVLDD